MSMRVRAEKVRSDREERERGKERERERRREVLTQLLPAQHGARL